MSVHSEPAIAYGKTYGRLLRHNDGTVQIVLEGSKRWNLAYLSVMTFEGIDQAERALHLAVDESAKPAIQPL